MRYKALKYFKTAEAFQEYLRNGGTSLDSVCIGGNDYTQEEYDHSGVYVLYRNLKTNTVLELRTRDRYKYGFGDAIVEIYEDGLMPRFDKSYYLN